MKHVISGYAHVLFLLGILRIVMDRRLFFYKDVTYQIPGYIRAPAAFEPCCEIG